MFTAFAASYYERRRERGSSSDGRDQASTREMKRIVMAGRTEQILRNPGPELEPDLQMSDKKENTYTPPATARNQSANLETELLSKTVQKAVPVLPIAEPEQNLQMSDKKESTPLSTARNRNQGTPGERMKTRRAIPAVPISELESQPQTYNKRGSEPLFYAKNQKTTKETMRTTKTTQRTKTTLPTAEPEPAQDPQMERIVVPVFPGEHRMSELPEYFRQETAKTREKDRKREEQELRMERILEADVPTRQMTGPPPLVCRKPQVSDRDSTSRLASNLARTARKEPYQSSGPHPPLCPVPQLPKPKETSTSLAPPPLESASKHAHKDTNPYTPIYRPRLNYIPVYRPLPGHRVTAAGWAIIQKFQPGITNPYPKTRATTESQADQKWSPDFLIEEADAMMETYGAEREEVSNKLQEAMSTDFFKMYPIFEDDRPKQAAKAKARSESDESEDYQCEMTDSQKLEKEKLLQEWKTKGDRNAQDRKRYRDINRDNVYLRDDGKGWEKTCGLDESVMIAEQLDGLDMFTPTLAEVTEEDEPRKISNRYHDSGYGGSKTSEAKQKRANEYTKHNKKEKKSYFRGQSISAYDAAETDIHRQQSSSLSENNEETGHKTEEARKEVNQPRNFTRSLSSRCKNNYSSIFTRPKETVAEDSDGVGAEPDLVNALS